MLCGYIKLFEEWLQVWGTLVGVAGIMVGIGVNGEVREEQRILTTGGQKNEDPKSEFNSFVIIIYH